jgi:hypothetical protein
MGAALFFTLLMGAFSADAPGAEKRAGRVLQIALGVWIAALIGGGMLMRAGEWWKMLIAYTLAGAPIIVLRLLAFPKKW